MINIRHDVNITVMEHQAPRSMRPAAAGGYGLPLFIQEFIQIYPEYRHQILRSLFAWIQRNLSKENDMPEVKPEVKPNVSTSG